MGGEKEDEEQRTGDRKGVGEMSKWGVCITRREIKWGLATMRMEDLESYELWQIWRNGA